MSISDRIIVLNDGATIAGGTPSGGEQQMLAAGTAIMSGPRLLMPDEPSLGLAPLVVMHVVDTLIRIKERGTAILMVEQDLTESLRIADRGYMFETSTVVLMGTRENLVRDEKLKQSYLGT
jgi:branched-chain amino acid transport system ATP-binding protein